MDQVAGQMAEVAARLERLNRLHASEVWKNGLNPTQRAALAYLGRANKFSRAPSHVAEYLAATRGTVSQTLKSLAQRGLIAERRSETDRRSISYDLTDDGHKALQSPTTLQRVLGTLPEEQAEIFQNTVDHVLGTLLSERPSRSFGLCADCSHARPNGAGTHCTLMDEVLHALETTKICHEHNRT